jgi:uncharacterized membrane protein YphA (DoxX/SURF4 family)
MPQTDIRRPKKAVRVIEIVVGWILAIGLALGFLLFGGIKLLSNPGMVKEFQQIGLGQWFRYFTGLLEVSAAIGLLIPRVRFWAALQIVAVMFGATFTNVYILHIPALARLTFVLMMFALALAWLSRRQLLHEGRKFPGVGRRTQSTLPQGG